MRRSIEERSQDKHIKCALKKRGALLCFRHGRHSTPAVVECRLSGCRSAAHRGRTRLPETRIRLQLQRQPAWLRSRCTTGESDKRSLGPSRHGGTRGENWCEVLVCKCSRQGYGCPRSRARSPSLRPPAGPPSVFAKRERLLRHCFSPYRNHKSADHGRPIANQI